MVSDEATRDWEAEYYQSGIETIQDFEFKAQTFQASAAVVSRPDGSGWISAQRYAGQAYDSSRADVMEGAWDHDHCTVCGDRLNPGNSCWANDHGQLLCDVCHEYVDTVVKPRVEGTPP